MNGATDRIDAEAQALVQVAQETRIQTRDQYVAASDVLKRIKTYRAQVAEAFDPIVDAAHAAHKAAVAQRKKYEAPAEEAERMVKGRMIEYQRAEEERRIAEERRLAEERRKAEEERKAAEAKAWEAETEGRFDEAKALLNAQASVPVSVAVDVATPKIEGIAVRKVWRYRIVDAGVLPREYLIPDERKIAGVVRAMRAETRIPGVEAYEESEIAARGAR